MKIAVVVGGFHRGNTADYVIPALRKLGHECELLDQSGFQTAAKDASWNLFLCVDSGETLQLKSLESCPLALKRTVFWFIDYRHNKNRVTRIPTDSENARFLDSHGGWIFQAQKEDVEDCVRSDIKRVSWLPMAADPVVWSDMPSTEKKFDVGFIGNIWDQGRLDAIQAIQQSGLKAALVCNGQAWKEQAAAVLRACKIGFNIASWYGTEFAFDVNMRFFEILSCGIPLMTNAVPSIRELFPELPPNIRTYASADEIVPVLKTALSDSAFLGSGASGREWILKKGTYEHRARELLQVCAEQQLL